MLLLLNMGMLVERMDTSAEYALWSAGADDDGPHSQYYPCLLVAAYVPHVVDECYGG